ncbi:endoribonuclease ZC3H12A isoform 1-T2 [Pholidichthys leucotaenia]
MMEQTLPSQNTASEADSEELWDRVDFFRKLGYTSAEVKAALLKLGLSTDTNSVLGELVRSRGSNAPSVSSSDSEERSIILKDPLLPPSWTLGPSSITPQQGGQNTNSDLRPIVVDGSNVAMSHGSKEVFSCRGIQLAVSFFLDRGHTNITVFVPSWRKEQPRADAPLTDQHILMDLEKQKIVVFTPSRRVGGKRVVCYDDRFIVKLAYESDGVIVSNDTYRDLQGERPEWKKCIEERLLMYSFVNDKFMPPDDPLGRNGPILDNFLRKKPLPVEQKRPLCPYDKKCTYGIKCKFYHPERTNQSYLSLADELREKAQISTGKEERDVRLSPRQLRSDSGPAHNSFSHAQDPNGELGRNQISSHPGHMTENKLLYWENLSPNHMSCSATGAQSQKDWPGLHLVPNHYYANMSHEYLDSGLGSFESQYSDIAHSHSNSQRHRLNYQGIHGPQSAPVYLEKKKSSQSSRWEQSHAVSSPTHQQGHRNTNAMSQPNYDTCHPHMFPLGVPHHHSLPSHFHYNENPHHQQNYWSDPFQGLPQPKTSGSLPSMVQPSHSQGPYCSNKGHRYNVWDQQQQRPTQSTFDSRRSELRQKLYAIFNPHQVDKVMEMFPHLMDAEKLAAEILNFKRGES